MEEINTNPEYKPITCPRCGSRSIEFVTEYHKYIWLRLLSLILGSVCAFFALKYIFGIFFNAANNYDIAYSITVGVFYFTFQLLVWLGESKTHVQGVCRDCGNIWLLD